jgi:hypothetical protein
MPMGVTWLPEQKDTHEFKYKYPSPVVKLD